VGVRGNRDDEGVGNVQQRVERRERGNAEAFRHLGCVLRAHVEDAGGPHAREGREQPRMMVAERSDPGDADPRLGHHATA
jgi:hypothetical protein